VSTHKANLLQKLALQNQSELIRYAIKHGLAGQNEP
jgi:DNA-binding CsgD family transcriptional regulator